MKTSLVKTHGLLLCAAISAVALTTMAGCATWTTSEVAAASSASLIDTEWKLTQLGEEIVTNPPGARAIHLVLQSQNQRVTGFAGCNLMMGRYVLSGDELKFDGMGGTKMFCEGRMEIEQRYLAMFDNVARWKITGNTLALLGADGKPIATFEAQPATS